MADYKGQTRTAYTEKQRLAEKPDRADETVKVEAPAVSNEAETGNKPKKRGRPSKK